MGTYPSCQRCPSVNKKYIMCSPDNMEVVGSNQDGHALDALLPKLQAVEADRSAQDALFEALKCQGACMIVTVVMEEPSNPRLLHILKYLRAMFAIKIWNDEVRLVKADANRFFIFAVSPGKALRAAISMRLLVADFHVWLGNICPDVGSLSKPATMKAGIHGGGILLIEGDCFGDPVNVASKLGEDIAQPREIIVSAAAELNESDQDMKDIQASCVLQRRQTEISGLTLDYFIMETQSLDNAVSLTGPSKAEVDAYHDHSARRSSMETLQRVVLTTDMSGFTRLTKTYGILHFLRLVLSARAIMVPAIEKVGGRRVKYEGDNIIAVFPNADAAVSCVKSCAEEFAVFNKSREKDFQVRIGYALDIGEVRILGTDIIGAAFECSFSLAEDMAEVGEVIVTERVKAVGWPSIESSTVLSDARVLEGTGDKYYSLSFL